MVMNLNIFSKKIIMGKRGVVLTFVGEHQKKGKWKSKFTSEALMSELDT